MSFFFLYLIMFVFEASLTIGPSTHNIVKERERERSIKSKSTLPFRDLPEVPPCPECHTVSLVKAI